VAEEEIYGLIKNYIMRKIFLLFLIVLVSHSCLTQTKEESQTSLNHTTYNFPELIGYVNDYALILDSLEVEKLERKLNSFSELTTNQMVIVTIMDDEITEENFEDFALSLSNYWGVGSKEKNNGLTIVLNPKLRMIRISTGLGIQEILTDEICERILQNIILPEFENEDYYNGLDKGTDELIKFWK